ncbi:Copper amine oxidase N-terminal domain-containing protein [Caminicella sporogenes DSM 14501]|uniref:Copper amine oxidase N-terminal domain-containing protein n=1 Tax=Caminicella sporogenes DSM 14501 TaxID=1121266 RepID=A0A1M6PQZ0_9FIRM|nr:stalk domain-containing protein [Caminicella sporogenes]RKD22009.1 hypothetical protein BET04_07095 [Caminicella sporogenes]SHK10409.1 Copper amine oxidase N-terminal domain-containing protein [Caminicella sporogenes DSM 14501]
MKRTKKYSYFMIGMIVGILISIAGVAFADGFSQVRVWLAGDLTFKFNGMKKRLPYGQTSLIYKDRVYVPARFIAENIGAKVKWIAESRTIEINYNERESVKKEEKEEITSDKSVEDNVKKNDDYDKLPITQKFDEAYITITGLHFDKDMLRIYLKVENKGDVPIQIDQIATKMIVDDKEYFQDDLTNVLFPYDRIWFNDIKKDDEIKGEIKMPPIDKDTKKLSVFIKVRENNLSKKEKVIRYDIDLEDENN